MGMSVKSFDTLRDPFTFVFTMLKHTNQVATSATRPNTIPQ